MAMFRWNYLSPSFAGGLLAKGAAVFLFSMVLADTKVHHAGCLFYVWERLFASVLSYLPSLALV